MSLFLSTFINKIDKKNRVSVPASFRQILSTQTFCGIIAYESFINPCIEACGFEKINEITNIIDNLDPYSSEKDAFATAILGSSYQLPFDSEGRILLPSHLIIAANISENVCFVGKGRTFEIWNPEIFATHQKNARKIALTQRGVLRVSN